MDNPEKETQNENNKPSDSNQTNEIKVDPDINSNNNKEINTNQVINSSTIIDSIFKLGKKTKISSLPKINYENFNKVIEIFNKGVIPKFENKNDLIEFIKDKIKAMKEIGEIIQNNYEVLYIMNQICKKNKFYIIEYYIDLYFEALNAYHTEKPLSDIMENELFNNEIITDLLEDINWILSCGFIEKKNFDYIFNKIASLHLSKNLSKHTFYEYLCLLEIFYGKLYDKKEKDKLIAKNYIYFYDRKNSGITTNISEDKIYVEIKEGISIIFWFYLTESMKKNDESVLAEIKINEHLLFEIILNNKLDIIIKCQHRLLKNKENSVFNIPVLKWVQLKILITGKQFKIYLYKDDVNSLISKEIDGHKIESKYETKTYLIEVKSKNLIIKSLNFFKKFHGIVGSIIFCNSLNLTEKAIKSESGIKNNEIYSFLSESPIFGNYFIFSPTFYIKEKNKFIDSTNNITGKFTNRVSDEEFNGVFKYKNYKNNIYSLGGIENIIPLFEIFYKFTFQIQNEEEEKFLHITFKKLIEILELLLINKKNYIESLYITSASHHNIFMQSLQLFLELIDEKFYQKDDDILNSLLNIGRYVYSDIVKTMRHEKSYYFFHYILFDPNIIIKFNLAQQEILWKFFEQGKNQKFRVSKSDIKKCFMSIEQINKFFILLSDKYITVEKEMPLLTSSLMNIIKVILEDNSTKDTDRENLLLLCNYKKMNENIIRGIVEIITSFIDIKDSDNSNTKDQKEYNYDIAQKTRFVNYLLNSNNNYIEEILKLFSCNLRSTKKVIIKIVQVLILKYGEMFENYFTNIENAIKKGKNLNKVSKKEFYHFVEEIISLNYFINKVSKQSENILFKNKNSSIGNDQQDGEDGKALRKKSAEFNYNIKDKNDIFDLNNNENNLINNKERKLSLRNKDVFETGLNVISNIEQNKIKEITEIKETPKDDEEIKKEDNEFQISHIILKGDRILLMESNIEQIEQDIDVNVKISEILFDLLVRFQPQIKNPIPDNSPGNNILNAFTKKGSIFDKNQKTKNIINTNNYTNNLDEERIINLLVKFLANTKEIEVIYKVLFLIINTKFIDNSFNRLLDLFCYTNTDFLNLIEEILIISYLYLNDEEYKNKNIFVFNKKNSSSTNLNTEIEYFNIIYNKANDLLISLYFHKNNKNKNKIINGIINHILITSNTHKNNNLNPNEKNIFNILLKLYEEFLEEVSIQFFKEINSIKMREPIKLLEKPPQSKSKNQSKEIIYDNNYPLYYTFIKTYFEFIPFLFEYHTLKNCFNLFFNDNIQNYEMKINAGFPEFYALNEILDYTIYYKFSKIAFDIFNINKSFEFINTKKKKTNIVFGEDKDIFIFDKKYIEKLINEYISGKDFIGEIRYKFELFMIKNNNNQECNYFTIVEMITILNNYYLEKYLLNEDSFKSENNKNNFNLIFFLNFHQYFITNILIVSCKIKDNEIYPINKSYKEIQDIFYNCLEYNLNNIIKNCDFKSNKYSEYFIKIFINIYSTLSKIYENYSEKSGKININKTNLKKFTESYSAINTLLFNMSSLQKVSKKNSFENDKQVFLQHKDKLINSILSRNPKNILDKPIIDIFEPIRFIACFDLRKVEAIKIKIMMNQTNNIFGTNEFIYFQNIFNKIQNLISPYENKNILNESLMSIKKRNKYRKLKKKLFSWNYSYSNFDIFYKNNFEKLKFKISNFLSKDLSRKLLVPILDFDFYVPIFKTFDYKKKLFKTTKDNSEQNQYDALYNIDLKIFKTIPNVELPSLNNQNFSIDEVCYVKTNHHINGLIFFLKNGANAIFFASKPPKKSEELMKNCNYDSENKRCFGSIFSPQFNPKECEIYFNMCFSDINFIFIRTYCFRNNSIEIFTKNHRSYYFKFEDYKKRNQFLDNLITKANKSPIKNYLFKPIKGFDESYKQTIIGYYQDSEENRPYSSISSISELYKSCKISTFEYLMWINIYGNRSYQDIGQYPVFPWLLINNESDKFETLISNNQNIRDFRLPLGMLYSDEKGKERQDGYIESYRVMIMDLYNQDLIKIKMKEEEECDEPKGNSDKNNQIVEGNKDKEDENIFFESDYLSTKKTKSIVLINSSNIVINNNDKNNDDKLPKFIEYNINLDKLYYNPNIPYEMLPYLYGSHFSNAMYVSHYLCRLFPYSFTSIEIQGIGFDAADRLFIHLQNSENSTLSEKGDLREIVPDFFFMPELFKNVNHLNLGGSNKNKCVDDVTLPTWCSNNPYLFVENYRSLLECGYLNINAWIDLIFGINQRGKFAESIGNVFLPFSYDGVLNFRVKPEDLINNRPENEYKIRLFEMGVHPTRVFDKKCKTTKNKNNEQITLKSFTMFDTTDVFHEVKFETRFKNIIYFSIRQSLLEEIFILDKSFIEQRIMIQENKEINTYSVKEISTKNKFPFAKYIERNIEHKLLVKQIFQNEIYVIAGLFDGELHLFKNTNKIDCNDEKYEYTFDKSIKMFDKSVITSLSIDKEEKHIFYGTQKGTIVIYSIFYYLYKEGKDFIFPYKSFQSHPGFSINYIHINSNLNLFADCAYDGFVNIYSLPKCNLVRSIYVDPNTENGKFYIDFVFLSAQPLASVSVYSNEAGNFKSFSINGKELAIQGNSERMTLDNDENGEKIKLNGMISPIMFTDSNFNDYLVYILNNKYVFINKFPTMNIIGYIYPSLNNYAHLTNLCVSTDLRYIYIYDEFNNMIYIVNHKL